MTTRKLVGKMILSVCVAAVAACDDDSEGPDTEVFTAQLSAANEPPINGVPVSSPATGVARVEFTPTGITYTVNVNGQLTNTITNGGAHIHGPCVSCVSAGVVHGLNPNTALRTGLIVQGAATTPSNTNFSMDSLKAMIRNGAAYVNEHTTGIYAGGESRGQLTPSN